MRTQYCRAHWMGRKLRVTPSKVANLVLLSQGTCFTCSCLKGLSCLIVSPEIDFLPESLVRFIYKVIPRVWYLSELFSWQNGVCLHVGATWPLCLGKAQRYKDLIRFNIIPVPWGFTSLAIPYLGFPSTVWTFFFFCNLNKRKAPITSLKNKA